MWKQKSSKKAGFSTSPSPLLPGLRGQGIIPIVIIDTDEINPLETATSENLMPLFLKGLMTSQMVSRTVLTKYQNQKGTYYPGL